MIAVKLGNFDVITVSETWLDNSINESDIHIPSYQAPLRLNRNRHGGGVAMYFKDNVPFVERTDLFLPNLEIIWAEVKLSNKSTLIGNFYLHPRFSEWHIVEYAIERAIQTCPNLILIGDFNENMLDPTKCNQSCQKDNIARRRQQYVNTVYRENFAPVLFSPFCLRANSKLGELNYTQGLI